MTEPDRWLTVEIPIRDDDQAGLLSEALIDRGARGTIESEGRLVAHFLPPDVPDVFLDDLRTPVRDITGAPAFDWSWTPQQAWEEVWKRGLRPRRVGRSFVVTPSWCEPEAGNGDRVIVIDPKMAFGTAEHASTRGCLRALEALVTEGQTVLDVGSGSGILAIAAVLLGADRVLAIESDPLAIGAAMENFEGNGVEDRVTQENRAVDAEELAVLEFDGCVANIQPGVLIALMHGIRAAVTGGGWVILSGIPVGEESAVIEAARSQGLDHRETDSEDGWVTLRFMT